MDNNENNNINLEKKSQTKINNKIIIIIVAILLLTTGVGFLLLGQNSSNSSNEENNNNDGPKEEINDNNIAIVDITNNIKNNTKNDKIYVKLGENNKIEEVYVNNKKIIKKEAFNEIDYIYQVDDDYLITIHRSDLNTDIYYLYDENGSLVQEINELEENNMIIAGNDIYRKETKVNKNVIELYGTRLTHGPSLVYNINNETEWLDLCDSKEISKASVDNNYVVVAKYQLIYSNKKIEIKRVSGTEETLGYYIDKICNDDEE